MNHTLERPDFNPRQRRLHKHGTRDLHQHPLSYSPHKKKASDNEEGSQVKGSNSTQGREHET